MKFYKCKNSILHCYNQQAGVGLVWICLILPLSLAAGTIYETTSPYHHIQVVDRGGIRILSFDGSMETRMSLQDPLKGHFEYTEYFHMPWLWNSEIEEVLTIGLGGGSVQRAWQHHYPEVQLDVVELDPAVVEIAKKYFHLEESPTMNIHISDGRLFLRRTRKKYDAVLVDAYTGNRYGSFIPHQLATQEFFQLTMERMGPEGVLVYNVIGDIATGQASVLGALYRTMKNVFPHVYVFPARESRNVILLATVSPKEKRLVELQRNLEELIRQEKIKMPELRVRLRSFRTQAPASAYRSPFLTDDHAPLNGLLSVGR